LTVKKGNNVKWKNERQSKNVEIAPAPDWLSKRGTQAGMKRVANSPKAQALNKLVEPGISMISKSIKRVGLENAGDFDPKWQKAVLKKRGGPPLDYTARNRVQPTNRK
jgi:hypothetical protein